MIAMWRTVCATVREVLAIGGISPHDVAGVSFSAHGKGLYLVDADGAPVRNGVISSDNRALPIVRKWKAEGVDAKAYPRGYQQLWSGHPVSLLAWLKANEPENYRRIRHVLMAHDWVRYKFTGAFGAEVTNISGSDLYNVSKGAYDPELFALFGVDEMLGCMPPILGSEQSLSGVSRAAAEETGLIEGTPVYGGFFDVVSAAVCAGLSDARFINVVMGTWTIVTWTTDHMETTKPHPYIWGRYCIPGRFFVHEGSPTSAGNLEWFVHTFMPDATNAYDRCNAMVESLGKGETNVQFLPYLFSSNLGDNLSAGFYGLANAHGLNHVVQAVYEGICFSQHVHLRAIRAPRRARQDAAPDRRTDQSRGCGCRWSPTLASSRSRSWTSRNPVALAAPLRRRWVRASMRHLPRRWPRCVRSGRLCAAGSARCAALPRQIRRIPAARRASGPTGGAVVSAPQQDEVAALP